MANYDELKGNMQALYDAAKKELVENEKKHKELLSTIELLAPICGGKNTYSVADLKAVEAAAPKAARRGRKPGKAAAKVEVKAEKAEAKAGKKPRIKEEVIRELILKSLSDAYPNSMSAGEILEKLNKAGLPTTRSFLTRIYGKLGTWTSDGILERVDRGVYKIVKPVEKA